MSRRVLCWLFPWFVLRRIRMLAESPFIYPRDRKDIWDLGYERAMSEVLENMGLDAEHPPALPVSGLPGQDTGEAA